MIPKSLHTITVLVNVARELRATDEVGARIPHGWEFYAARAVRILGYTCDAAADPYGLRARAIAILEKSEI